MRVLALWRQWFPRALDTGDLAERGQVRMLELTHQRLAQGIFAMPLLGVLFTMWFQGLGRNPLGMLAWTVLYTLAAAAVWVQSRQLRASRSGTAAADDAAWLRRWRSRYVPRGSQRRTRRGAGRPRGCRSVPFPSP